RPDRRNDPGRPRGPLQPDPRRSAARLPSSCVMAPYADGRPRLHRRTPGGRPSPGRRAGFAGLAGGEDAPGLAGKESEQILLDAVWGLLDDPPHLATLPGDDEGRHELDLEVRDGGRRLLLLAVDSDVVDLERDLFAHRVQGPPQAGHLALAVAAPGAQEDGHLG